MAKVSIVIPTLNGADFLPEIFKKIEQQETSHKIEMSIVDSGSTDGTLKIIEDFSKKFKTIVGKTTREQFNHGVTRNQAIEQSNGEFVVLLTQDAIPGNEFWLDNLVKPLENDTEVAGVFGRHLPRHDCNPFDRRELPAFFASFGTKKTIFELENKKNPSIEYEKKKFILAFFSSNNSAIRKSVWKQIPFRKVEILGEDQFWAKDILLAGYKKVYSPDAFVLHSHNYSPIKAFQRWVDDYRFYEQIHNYSSKTSLLQTILVGCKLALDNRNYIENNLEFKNSKENWKRYGICIAFSRVFAEYVASKWNKIPSFFKPSLSMEEKRKRKLGICGK